jgi:hypothetical protein
MAAVPRRIVAYDVLGDERGQVPNALRVSYISRLNEPASLDVDEADLADFPDLLDGWHAVRFERYNQDGDNWRRDLNDMLILQSVDLDPLDPLKVTSRHYVSVATLLMSAPIFELDKDGDPPDVSLGPTRPVRSFHGKTPGGVMNTLLEEAQAAGWCPGFLWTFNGTEDSDGMAWPVSMNMDIPVDYNLYSVLDMLAGQGWVDWCTQGNALEMYVAGTYLNEDLSVGEAPVTLYNGMGVTKAPVERTYRDQATDVRGVTEDGKVVEANNPDLTLPVGVGRLWRTARISGTADSSTADFALQAELRIGGGARESFTREVDYDWTDPDNPTVRGIQPGLDFEIGSRIRVDSDQIDGDGNVKHVTHRVLEYRVKIADDQTQKGHLILANRQERAIDRQQRALARIAGGAAGGWLGDVIKPLMDLRRPDEPDEPVMDAYTELVAGETRVTFLATVTANSTTHDTEGGVEEPIQIARVHLYAKRGGSGEMLRVRSVDWVEPSVVLDYPNQDPNTDYTFKALSESHDGFLSHLSTSTDAVNVPADQNPLDRTNLVEDAAHVSDLRQLARIAATTGLSFLTDGTAGTVAALSTTSSVLRYGVTGAVDTPNAGRFKVQAGDTVYSKAMIRHVGASSATVKAQVTYFYNDLTSGTQTAATQATTGSYALIEGTTSPTKDGFAEIKFILDSIIGTGTARIAQAYAARQLETHDLKVGSVTADIINVGTLNGVHITGLIIDAGELNAGTITGGVINGSEINGVEINGAVINAGEFYTVSNGISIVGDVIAFGGGVFIVGDSGAGTLDLSAGTVVAGTDLHVSDGIRANTFTPWTQPTITGSRGGNVALADLLSSLDFLGLIADGSSA